MLNLSRLTGYVRLLERFWDKVTLVNPGASIFLSCAPGVYPESTMTFIMGLFGFVALIFAARFFLRWMARRPLPSGEHIKILDRIAVTRDAMLMLVEVAGRIVLIGVSKDKTEFLCEFDSEEITDSPDFTAVSAPTPSSALNSDSDEGGGFVQRFLHNFKIAAGFAPKNAQPLRPDTQPPRDRTLKRVVRVRPGAGRVNQAQSFDFNKILQNSISAPGAPREPEQPAPKLPANYMEAIERVKQYANIDEPIKPKPVMPVQSYTPPKAAVREPVRADVRTNGVIAHQEARAPIVPVIRQDSVVTSRVAEPEETTVGVDMSAVNLAKTAVREASVLPEMDTLAQTAKPDTGTGKDFEAANTADKDYGSANIDSLLDLVAGRTERYSSKSSGGGRRND